MTARITALIVCMLVVATAGPVAAQSSDGAESGVMSPTPKELPKGLLASIDSQPTRAQLDAISPDIRTHLEGAAHDSSLSIYERRRAIGFLSLYPDARTREFYRTLTSSPDADIRRTALYTMARTFGAAPDAELVKELAAGLEDGSADVREWAVRGLRWVADEDARTLLRQIAAGEDASLARIARRALKKHALEQVDSVQ
jgi:HEAT repeat protein